MGCSGYEVMLVADKCFVKVQHLWPGLALKLIESMGTLSIDSFKLWITFLPWQKKSWQFSSPHRACQMACNSAKTYGDFWSGGGSLQRGTSQFCFAFRCRKANITRLLRYLLLLHPHFSNNWKYFVRGNPA